MTEAQPYDDADRAAVMVMLLEDDQAATLLARLEPHELRLLGEKMCALGEIQPEVIAHAIANFVERTEKMGLIAHDRVGHVRSLGFCRLFIWFRPEPLNSRLRSD